MIMMRKSSHVAVVFMLLAIGSAITLPLENYWTKRASILQVEDALALGGHLQFQTGERIVNDIFMTAKREELDKGFRNPSNFSPAINFLEAKRTIEKSGVYQLIRRMPKGAVLHSHDTAIVSAEFVFNLTYRANLYVCEAGKKPGEKLALRFFGTPNTDCNWSLLSDLRKNPEQAKSLNERIHKQMSMYDPAAAQTDYADGNIAWIKFMSIFMFITPMLTYRPIYEEHYYQGLQELYDDNVFYLELRSTLPPLYELNGTVYSPVEVARIYKKVTDRFVKDHPFFIGAKLIYAPIKTTDPAEFDSFLNVAVQLKEALPDFVAGFDLVGQEDTASPLVEWVDKIKTIATDIPFFFHAGETNWNGMSVDENLIDAVLLGAKRIGHGYALTKHPKLMKLAKRNKIAIEICPISNQVLALVKDVRNHPASVLFAQDFPVVVANDDPGLWGSKALSYDFYEAFMGIMSAHSDLRALKQLALNSIEYSSLNNTEKKYAYDIWYQKWDVFINSFFPDYPEMSVFYVSNTGRKLSTFVHRKEN